MDRYKKGLVYEDKPKYDTWLKGVLIFVLATTLVPGIILLSKNLTAAYIMLGATVFDALLFKIVLPQKYQIFENRLVLVFGWPFTMSIPFSNIVEILPVSGRKALIYWGLKFATSESNVIEVVRKKGLNLIISPSSARIFLEKYNQARTARR